MLATPVFLVVLLQVALLSGNSFSHGAVVERGVTDNGTHLIICKQNPIDLGIVLDSSVSIAKKDFKAGKKFLQDFLGQFEIGDGEHEGVRVSLITYGRGIYPDNGFNLTTYLDKGDLVERVGNLEHRQGTYTSTGEGIEYMHLHQLDDSVARPSASKIAVVITDGNSQERKKTEAAAVAARADNITIFAVGVGRRIRDDELELIAGDKSRVVKVASYDDLELIKEELAHRTCIRKEKPTTTPLPKTQTCGELDPADIFFVFDPSTLGLDNLGWTSSFIGITAENNDMQDGFQFGVMAGPCPDEGFNLDAYTDPSEIRDHLRTFDTSHFEDILQRLVDQGFTDVRGARPDSKKVAVLVNPGPQMKGKNNVADYVSQLTAQGVEVFYADPTNLGMTIPGAVSLHGRGARAQAETLIGALCPQKTKDRR